MIVIPMRICMFSYVFFPCIGGLQQVGASLCAGWVAQGHKVILATVTSAPDELPDYDKQFPYEVIRLTLGKSNRDEWKTILDRCDILVSSGVSLTYWLTWARIGKPVFFIHHIYLGNEPYSLPAPWWVQEQRRVRIWLRRMILRRAAGNIFISRWIQQHVAVRNGIVIYNPVDPGFRPIPNTTIDADFAYFGRIIGEKGVGDLLDALAICHARGHRFTLNLYGDGITLDELKQHASQKGLEDSVRWRSFVRGAALVEAMNAAAVIVIPSIWNEPMGIVAIEAMACGKCVIGSAGGGLGEVLKGYCPTFANHEPAQLADQMIRVMTDNALLKQYEQAAFKRSQDFLLDRVAAQYIEYFNKHA